MSKPTGRIKSAAEDFLVEELPLYEPCGEGEHLYVRFEKRGLTTDEAVRRIAQALGVRARDVGVAGLKDKHGITRQTISLIAKLVDRDIDARAAALVLDGISVLSVARHRNKLKTGHLAGNRFVVVVRDVPETRVEEAIRALVAAGEVGVPNAFGDQRFGRDRDNATVALRWLNGEDRGPSDQRKQRFLVSALQSAIFNRVLERRVADGTWASPMVGDVLQVSASGGLFLCADVQVDRERALRREVSPTGPMPGPKMVQPLGEVLQLEFEEAREIVGEGFDWSRTARLAEGTRRALRLDVEAVEVARVEVGLRVSFVLPPGAYATTVLGHVFAPQAGEAGEGREPV